MVQDLGDPSSNLLGEMSGPRWFCNMKRPANPEERDPRNEKGRGVQQHQRGEWHMCNQDTRQKRSQNSGGGITCLHSPIHRDEVFRGNEAGEHRELGGIKKESETGMGKTDAKDPPNG